jgi:predicted aminopeptidase
VKNNRACGGTACDRAVPFFAGNKSRAMRTIIILFLCLPFLASCANTLYMGKLAWGEAKIVGGEVPNNEVLGDKKVAQNIKDGIRLVQEVKEFARQRLGLHPGGSYETFFQVKGDTLIYLVSACPKNSLEPYTWRFPIVGRVEYKGFFSKKDAVKETQKLDKKGLDTCIQQVIAFSTLGWLSDPLYSTILDQHPVVVINVVIHELVHNTIYFKGETEFNEQIASLIAEKGALMFIEERFGLHSPSYQLALELDEDERIMARFFQELYDALKGLYAQNLPQRERLRMREEIFARGQGRLAELSKQLRTGNFTGPLEGLNNAVVLAYRRYLTQSDDLLQQAYEACGGDVRGFIALLLTVRKSKEPPYRFLKRWLQERSSHLSG